MNAQSNSVNENENGKSVTTVTDEETTVREIVKGTKGFVFMDDVKRVLDVAFATRKNLILFGKGGYGKSEYALDYLEEHNIEPYVITMGTGMTTDRLFGGLDLPTFNQHGKIEYLVENSFMNHEVVIFEELFDAPDFILEQLKDILSAKVFRNGSQIFELKTKVIICCTNKTREEFAKNTSLKALMERFPLEFEVKWANHTRITYQKLLETKLGFADPLLTYVLEQYAVGGHTISPRIAIVAADLIDRCGPECLSFIADFNQKPELLKGAIAKFKGVIEMDNLLKEMEKSAEEFRKLKLNNSTSISEGNTMNKKLATSLAKLKSIKVDDSTITALTEQQKKYTKIHDDNKKQLDLLVHMIEE